MDRDDVATIQTDITLQKMEVETKQRFVTISGAGCSLKDLIMLFL